MTWVKKVVLSSLIALTMSVACSGCERVPSALTSRSSVRTETLTVDVLPLEVTPVSIPTVSAVLPLTVTPAPTRSVVTVSPLAVTAASTRTSSKTLSPTATASPVPTKTRFPIATPSPTEREPLVYTVQAGDTLYSISRRYGTTVKAIMETNELSDQDFIWVGQRLLVPSSSLPFASTPAPRPTSVPTPSPTLTPTPRPTADLCTGSILSKEVGDHTGEATWVLCPVASSQHWPDAKGEPLFLDCDEEYPDQTLSVIIWGKDRHEFPSPLDEYYQGKTICVYGLIWTFGGKPAIVARDSSQIGVLGS